MSAPFNCLSGAPMWSRRARVRSVPSFIAKRPCREMKSRASSNVNDSRATANLSLKRVLDQHRPRHRADPARIRGQPPRHLLHTMAEIAGLASVDPVRAHVHDRGARLDHVAGDQVGAPRGRDEDVCRPGVTRSVEQTSELQSPMYLVCGLVLEKKTTI